MGFLDLPAELRLRIYEYLPELMPGRYETVTRKKRLTPTICRVSRKLCADTLGTYVQNAQFNIEADDDSLNHTNPVKFWLEALGPFGIKHIKVLQLSRYWKILQPSRWEGHVAFYVRLERRHDVWECSTGTQPMPRDRRGMRRESVDCLRCIVNERLATVADLARLDVDFLLQAMDVVACHPIPVDIVNANHSGNGMYPQSWRDMERQLSALNDVNR